MKKMFKKARIICIVSALSVSLCFGSVTTSYYQAAALAPAVWTLIETLFLSLGITLLVSESVDKEVVNVEIAQDVEEFAEKVESGEQKGPLLELADCLKNIHMYWEPVTGLTFPQTAWEALKYYCGFQQEAAKPIYVPAFSDINLYGCTYDQYIEYWAGIWNVPISDSFLLDFTYATYDDFVENDYSCLLVDYGNRGSITVDGVSRYIGYYVYFSLDNVSTLRFREKSVSNPEFMLLVNQNNASLASNCLCHLIYFFDDMTLREVVTDGYGPTFGDVQLYPSDLSETSFGFKRDYYIVSHGRFYDMFDILQFPKNDLPVLEYGNEVNVWTDFLVPQMDICTGVTADCVIDIPLEDYDVKTPGREWDEEKEKLVGDVTLNIPSQNALDDYYNGLITWDELMEQIGAEPVDTTKPLEGEIPKEDTSAGIIDVILDIPGAIVDGIKGLFVPRDGFIEAKLGSMINLINSVGIVPFDMSILFRN